MSQTKIDRLFSFAYGDGRSRWQFYVWTMAIAIVYGTLNGIVLDRPEKAVTLEVIAICVLGHVVFLWRYLLANQAIAVVKKRSAKLRSIPPLARSWQFPRFLPYAGLAAALILAAMAIQNNLQAKVLDFSLTVLPSSVVSAHVSTILDGAREHNVIISPAVVRRNGLKFTSAKNPNAWLAAKATLDYRSFLNKELGLGPNVTNAETPRLDFAYKFALPVKANASGQTYPGTNAQFIAQVKVEGADSSENSARLEMLSSPPSRGSGVKLITVDAKANAIPLDGAYWKNVVVKDAEIEFDGGPVKLENVYFVNCEFNISPTPAGRALAAAILNGAATNFSSSKAGSVEKSNE